MAQINKPDDYFNTVTWTGNGSKITTGLRPDLIWYKARDVSDYAGVVNAIIGDDYYLQTYSTDAETYYSGLLVSDSTGFTPSSIFTTNSYVAWNWLAGGTGASNTDGSITSTVSANTTNGFSIVSWTGTGDGTPASSGTLGHGLGSAPKMIIVKNRTDATNWPVYHAGNTSAPETEIIYLNLTNATADDNNFWNDTAPSSSVFTVAGDNSVNGSGDNMIAYCFAEKKGFSKFGSYTGNGNADGTFVYTGFKPSFVMHKRTDTTNNWIIQDNKRVGYNADNRILKANLTDAEQGVHEMDFVSNGFKIRTTGLGSNASGGTYIYMAFAENPFVTSTGIPACAR